MTTERCRFRWPGYDLRRTPDGRERYGILSRVQVRALLVVVAENQRRGKFETVERDD